MKIGFIGLGRMGSAMATNLLKAGFDVTVFNRSADKLQPLVQLGAHAAARIAEAAGGDIVITMLANDSAVGTLVWGKGGIIESLPGGSIHISMSTISVLLADELSKAHARAGQRFVSAPVFGRPEVAAAGKLFIVAGGDAGTLSVCQPLFDVIGQRTFPIAVEPQIANLIKLSGNFLIASVMEAMGEAIALVGKAGVNRNAYVELLTSSIFPAPIYRTYGDLIASSRFQPAGFLAPLGYKDIRLTLAAADSLRVPMPLAGLLRDRFLRLLANGGEAMDWSAIGGLASEDAQSRATVQS